MSKNLKYWLWLQKALGEGAYLSKILEDFKSAKELYDANVLEWKMSTSLTAKQVNLLASTDINSVNEIIYNCESNGWKIIDYEDNEYPQRLKEIINPPAVLYIDGQLPNADDYAYIAVVGTRKASDYSIKVAHIMSKGCAEAGAVIISGGALGVDSSAHRGAIMAEGKTVAVLGCGLGTKYLYANRDLRDAIRQNGALVTEYPPFTPASKTTFPMRNRLISALSVGVLVVEAGVKSGSLITANYALEQGRDVFAIPAPVIDTDYDGTNKLIDDGAVVVTKPIHLVAMYANRFDTLDVTKVKSVEEYINDSYDRSVNVPPPEKVSFTASSVEREQRQKTEIDITTLTGNTKTVYSALSTVFEHISLISEKTELPSAKVMSALTELELRGLAVSASGKRYKKS